MKHLIVFFASILFFASNSICQNVGINTTTPQAALDVNGDIIFRTSGLVVANGITAALDVNGNKFSYYRIEGPTADFIFAGISAGMDGRLITLFNRSGFAMQLNNVDIAALPENQIITGSNADLIIGDRGIVNLQYDNTEQKWIVKSNSKSGSGVGVWDTTGMNIVFNTTGNVGIGTDVPSSKLTVQTELNTVGFSHVGGANEIILSSNIGSTTASFGTSTNNVFSLNAGGNGNLHIWPNGSVVVGDNSGFSLRPGTGLKPGTITAEPTAKLTIQTPLNSTGWTHIGGNNEIILDEVVGGVSAAIGTSSNHAFRIFTNGVGKLSIYPAGEVVIGANSVGSVGMLTVKTTNNADGISHIGDNGNILKTIMGGTSAGIGTFSNTHMRILANKYSAIFIAAGTGNVGINTDDNNPAFKLDVAGRMRLRTQADGNSAGVWLNNPANTNTIAFMGIADAVTTGFYGNVSGWGLVMNTNTGNVGIGTLNPTYKLSVNGDIRSKEVVVEAGWADYVFDEKYKLKSLDEVEKFILQNKHLPNIPSAKEVEEKGLHLGDIQKKMMEKIEELTLYVIELKKEVEVLKKNQDNPSSGKQNK